MNLRYYLLKAHLPHKVDYFVLLLNGFLVRQQCFEQVQLTKEHYYASQESWVSLHLEYYASFGVRLI